VRTQRTNEHQLDARTTLTPSSSFNIDLNWEVSWSTEPKIDFRRLDEQPGSSNPNPGTNKPPIERFRTETGSGTATIWAFGSYQAMVEAQLDKLRTASTEADTLGAGAAPLTTTSTTTDFRNGYLFGALSIAGNGFVPLPLPGWTVRYSGLSDWPLLKNITESVSLNHSYNATYETSFTSNSTAGELETIPLGDAVINYREAEFAPGSARISEQYQPLIGLDITWPWDFDTSLEWRRTIRTRLVGSNVVERKTSEISGSFSYSKRGLRLPLLPRIDNRIRLSVSFTRSSSNEREFLLNEALGQAQRNLDTYSPQQALDGSSADVLTEQTRTTVSPTISYTVSNRVTADFQLEFEKLDVQTGRQTSFTNVNGTFNLNVSLSQN
jgi:cell surface protein SprA